MKHHRALYRLECSISKWILLLSNRKKNSSLKISDFSVVVINCIARSSSARLCQETKTYFFQVCLPRSRMSIHGIMIIIIIIVVVVQLLLSFTFSSASWRFFLSVESSSFNSLISVFVLKTFMSKRKKEGNCGKILNLL